MPAPRGLDWSAAAAIPEAFLTAWDGLLRQLALQPGEWAWITAVGSGVGTAALQLAWLVGARTVGSSRSPEKLARARALGLEAALDTPVGALTLGGKKRLELARALATGPRLLLLDEVFAGLNPAESAGAVALVRRIRDELGVTVLLVEHVMRIVMGLCDHVVVLGSGQVIAQGPPSAIAADPQVRRLYLGEDHRAAG